MWCRNMVVPHSSVPTPPNRQALALLGSVLAWSIRATAFWLAVVLPFLHLPLLLGGLDGNAEQLVFAGLLALNVVALVVGHEYRQ